MNKGIIKTYLEENNYDIDSNSSGINLVLDNKELIIKGSSLDLIELADYITQVALSDKDNDHLHLDELTLLNKDNDISSLIIEKNWLI